MSFLAVGKHVINLRLVGVVTRLDGGEGYAVNINGAMIQLSPVQGDELLQAIERAMANERPD